MQIHQRETLNHQGTITHEVCCLAAQCMKYNFQEFNMRQKYLSLFSAICYCLDADISERLVSVQEGIKEQAIALLYSHQAVIIFITLIVYQVTKPSGKRVQHIKSIAYIRYRRSRRLSFMSVCSISTSYMNFKSHPTTYNPKLQIPSTINTWLMLWHTLFLYLFSHENMKKTTSKVQ